MPVIPGPPPGTEGEVWVDINESGPAVRGRINLNLAIGKVQGFLAGLDPVFNEVAGVYGESDQAGVFGNSDASGGTGVHARGGGPGGFGVRGEVGDGVAAVHGHSFGSGLAGKFIGDVDITGRLTANGHDVGALLDQLRQAVAQLPAGGRTDAGNPVGVPTPAQRPTLVAGTGTTHGGPGPQTIVLTGAGYNGVVQRVQVIRRAPGGGPTTTDNVGGPLPLQLGARNGEHLVITATDGVTRDDNDVTGTLWSSPLVIDVF